MIIIGAGPAGLAAGLTTAHRALTTLVVEAKDRPGGQPQFLYPDKRIVDIPRISRRDQWRRTVGADLPPGRSTLPCSFRFNEELVDIEDTDQTEKEEFLKCVVTNRDRYLCRKVIISCGLLHFPRRLPVLAHLDSLNVHYKMPRISDYEGKNVAVVGGGDSALDAAVMALERRGHVDLIVRESVPRRKNPTLFEESRNREASCTRVAKSRRQNRPETASALTITGGSTLPSDVIIVQIGFLSAKDTFKRLGVRLSDDGSIAIDPYFETSRRGIFAVGDVHGDIKLITVAWAEGIQAAIYAFKEITSPYWLNERRLRDQKIALIGDKIALAARKGQKRRRG